MNYQPGDRVSVPLGSGTVFRVTGTVFRVMGERDGELIVQLDCGPKCWVYAKDIQKQEQKETKMNQIKDDETVTTTAGRIRSAAGKCPQADTVLREVYPDVFKERHNFQLGDIVKVLGGENIEDFGIIITIDDSLIPYRVQFFGHDCGGYQWKRGNNLSLVLRPIITCSPK